MSLLYNALRESIIYGRKRVGTAKVTLTPR
jgi:hypothetical protein